MALIRLAVAALVLLAQVGVARAQSTDGYHAIQVFPVVVDTASFKQRFHFRGITSASNRRVTVMYYPADGTGGSGPIACPDFDLPGYGEIRFDSLRSLCSGPSGDLLPGASAFGTLVVTNPAGQPFAAYSRVSNMAGAGFSVEPIRASDFTAAQSVAIGLRRTAATATEPAYQTNCFVGMLAEREPPSALSPQNVTVILRDRDGQTLGQTAVSLLPGRLVRLLDVFAAVGLTPGDYVDVSARFVGPDLGPGLIPFCTVQDNTSFGADFRIAKQEQPIINAVIGANDYLANRSTLDIAAPTLPEFNAPSPYLTVAAGKRNVHQVHFRHPDIISCGILSHDYQPLTPSHGLEMRLLGYAQGAGWTPVAGGNDVVRFEQVYLGDKRRWLWGANIAYYLEVESNGQQPGSNIGYFLECRSGSGHSWTTLLFSGAPTTF